MNPTKLKQVSAASVPAAVCLLSSLFFAVLFFTGCNGPAASSAAATGSSGAAASDANGSVAGEGSGGGDASFSAKIDGRVYSSSGTDQNSNAAFRVKDGDKPIFFKLADMNDPTERFNFEVPAKQGSTTFNLTTGYNGYINGFVTYLDDGVTVNVLSISATRISGTFSGKYTLVKGSSATAKASVEVTDGKFDIPFSTSEKMKKFNHAE